jgi:hypothetical protein
MYIVHVPAADAPLANEHGCQISKYQHKLATDSNLSNQFSEFC